MEVGLLGQPPLPEYLMNAYIEGAKARANKEPFKWVSDEWTEGYEYMQNLLSPIETRIVQAALQFKVVAETAIREMEERFRDRGTAEPAGASAGSARPSERPTKPSETGLAT